ncbi:MAG TPA: B12-binding domain-containing radical SAM protein [bacterium]|nr:B12-binding domain-containing radical SAM protein [bacterium]
MHILLINPYIHDFALYDLWMRPHGLLKIGATLRALGCGVSLINCLDRKDPAICEHYRRRRNKPRADAYDCGRFPKTEIEKPAAIAGVPRRYYRYGIPLALLRARLAQTAPPDIILVTSGMTYWYPGVQETIVLARERFPRAPILLGGIYPTICPGHAESHAGADRIFSGSSLDGAVAMVSEMTGKRLVSNEGPAAHPPPAYDLLARNKAAAIQTSCGCPFSCTYCASKIIAPEFRQRPHDEIIDELAFYKSIGIENIAFYDDALLCRAERHFVPLMERLIAEALRFNFHTPNGLHARYMTPAVARLMKDSGFKTIRLSMETSSPERQQHTGGKVTNAEFAQAVRYLTEAGFAAGELDAYLLAGAPGQRYEEVEKDITFARSLGVRVNLASYAAIPGTADWDTMIRDGIVAPDLDPLLHDDTVFPTVNHAFSVEKMRRLRQETAALNKVICIDPR